MSIKGWWKRKNFFFRNPDVYAHYLDIKQYNASTVKQREDKLREIKQYAIDHTKFYANYQIDDVFPVMTKLDFLNAFDQIRSDEVFRQGTHKASTSGSTGVPFTVEQDYSKRRRTIADLKVFGEYADYPSHEKMLQLRAYNGRKLDRNVDKRENIFRYDISFMDGEHLEQLVDYMNSLKPRIVFGYTSTLETVCDYILDNRKELTFQCKSVLVGAETLSDEVAHKIQKAFACPVYDRYSNMEMGIYSQRKYGQTNFKINRASYYLEVLKLDSDEPACEGELGRIVFTDLYNHAFPMIRYDTGDVGKYCYNHGEIELKEVYGRRADCVFSVKNELLDPHSISIRMWGVENVRQWQFVQKDVNSYVVVISKSADVDEEDVKNRLKSVLGEDARISIAYVQSIPVLNSQKRKYIVNEMKK